VAVGLLLLHLGNPLTWRPQLPALWFPSAGVGVLLVAWLGARAAVLVAADAFLVVLLAAVLGRGLPPGGWVAPLWDAALAGPEAWAAWWVYHRLARGDRRLGEPRSAVLFLLLVPGLVTGLFAGARALPLGLSAGATALADMAAAFWVGRALGLAVLVPPLLVQLTPWLVRYRLAVPGEPAESRSRDLAARLALGDWLEVLGLAIATGTLSLLLVEAQGGGAVAWQFWVLPLLLIVWASLRQGVRGGTTVAAVSAGLALGVSLAVGSPALLSPLQGYLLAQCSTALLVGASCSWLHASEARHRQVVERIPVVLYSARLREEPGPQIPSAFEITFVSPASRQLLGVGPQDLLGSHDHWLRLVHPDDRELITAAVAQLRHHKPVTCEYRLGEATPGARSPASRVRWLRDTLVPLLDAAGEVEGWEGIVEEVTEQRALAHDLRRTTSMLHTLVAHLPAGVFFVQAPGGRPILVNARARKLLGQREDLAASLTQWPEVYRLFRPDGSLYPADELPVCVALRRGIRNMRDDIVVHRPDGRRIPLVTWAAPINLGGGDRSDAAVWVLEDLTAVQQAEAAHRESEARLRAVIATLTEGLEVYDDQGVVCECNPAACALLGRPADQIIGRALTDPGWGFVREDGSPCPADEHPAAVSLRTGKPVCNAVLGWPANAGLKRWLLGSAVPLFDGRQATPSRVIFTFLDITAQRQALDVLRASEEQYRGLVEGLPIMLIQFDRDLRVTYVNPATTAISGFTAADLHEAAAWQTWIHPDDLPRTIALGRQTLEGQPGSLEIRYRIRDGSEKIGYVLYQPRREGGAVVGGTALICDITVQRRLEQELQHSQRLELVGRLAGGIAHDFNNLLTVVIGLASQVANQFASDHPVREDLQRIMDAGEQAARLAGQLLAFSKQRRTPLRPVDVNTVVLRTLELLRGTLPRTVAVETHLGPAELPVLGDETQLQQVVMNLCLNARDAMPEGGRLRLRTEAGDGRVRLRVEDTGVGMAEEVRARAFEPFFSTKENGTGLGLAVVRQIVEGLGGGVAVWSEPGAGARFDVWLPQYRA
jgi:PAS domain S-box-containing protein